MTGPTNIGFLSEQMVANIARVYQLWVPNFEIGVAPLLFSNIRWDLSISMLDFRESFYAVIEMFVIWQRYCALIQELAVLEGCNLTGLRCRDKKPTVALRKFVTSIVL